MMGGSRERGTQTPPHRSLLFLFSLSLSAPLSRTFMYTNTRCVSMSALMMSAALAGEAPPAPAPPAKVGLKSSCDASSGGPEAGGPVARPRRQAGDAAMAAGQAPWAAALEVAAARGPAPSASRAADARGVALARPAARRARAAAADRIVLFFTRARVCVQEGGVLLVTQTGRARAFVGEEEAGGQNVRVNGAQKFTMN